jgi:hypothetical protein
MSKLFDLVEMKRRLAAIDAERDPLVQLIAAAEAYEGQVGETIRESDNLTNRVRRRVRPLGIGTGKPPSGRQLTVNIATELMEASGKPVQTREVLETMKARGLPLPDKNIINVISARMSNSGKFEGRRGIGWWFVDRPWPGEDGILALDAPNENEASTEGSGDASETAREALAEGDHRNV